MLQDRRGQVHAHMVAAIKRLYADRLSEHLERLANHAQRGRLWDEAAGYSRQAGNRALDRSAAREALAHFEQARIALNELPESRERTEQMIDLCFAQRSALHPLGEFARQGEILNEARALAERINDQRRLGWILAYQANPYDFLGEHTRAIERAEQSIADLYKFAGLHALRMARQRGLGQVEADRVNQALCGRR